MPAMGFFVFMLSGGVVTAFLYGPWVPEWGQVAIMNVISLAALAGMMMVPSEIMLMIAPEPPPVEEVPEDAGGGDLAAQDGAVATDNAPPPCTMYT